MSNCRLCYFGAGKVFEFLIFCASGILVQLKALCFWAVCESVRLSVPNVVSMMSWKVSDIFSPNFQNLWQVWTLPVLESKGQSSRSWWIQHAWKCTCGLVNAISWITGWISPNFGRWCILEQGWIQFCGSKGQRSRSQHDQRPSGQRHTEFDVDVSSSNF